MSSAKNDIEVDAGEVRGLTFTMNGEYLVSGGCNGVQVQRVKDGEQARLMKMKATYCVAASNDGQFIGAGSFYGEVSVWNARNYRKVFAHEFAREPTIYDVDFSPDSSCLVSADGGSYTATVWDIHLKRQLTTLVHGGPVLAARYSPQGDRIATASQDSVRVWDTDNGRLLVDVKEEVNPWRGLLWFNGCLLLMAKDNIKQIAPDLTISRWSVPGANCYEACIALSQHAKFVAYSTKENITFWDAVTHKQLGVIAQSTKGPIAFSPDDQLLAIVESERKIIIKRFAFVNDPDICIDNTVLDAWKDDRFTDAEALLTAVIPTSKQVTHHVLATRALVRARLLQWEAALSDAEESIKIRPSIIGYIAKCVVLVRMGKVLEGCRVCDIAFQHHSDHASLLLLIKAVVLFIAGECEDAMSRIADLISTVDLNSTLYIVQAYMLLLRGDLYMESDEYDCAIQSFKDARVKLRNCTRPPPAIVFLVSGWKFDGLAITIQQRLSQALLSAGHANEAAEAVLHMVEREAAMIEPIKTWVSEFMQHCLSTPENNGAVSSVTINYHISHPMTRLLNGWVRLRVTTRSGSWKEALAGAADFVLPKSTIYQVVCEHLEVTDQVVDAVTCFHQMYSEQRQQLNGERGNGAWDFEPRYRTKLEDPGNITLYGELGQETGGKQATWTQDFASRCCGKLEVLGDNSMNIEKYDGAVLQYTTALSLSPVTRQTLLGKRSTAHTRIGAWGKALDDADEAIKLDPSSPSGYERRYAALVGMGRYGDATTTFETMLLKMSGSSDPEAHERSRGYVRPEQTKQKIRAAIEGTIRDYPSVLINTASGRLCNRSEQVSTFETTLTFTELISTPTTHIDNNRIEQEVEKYYRYATFSHRWGANEPLFEKVIGIVVDDLEVSPAHEKLKTFCRIVREEGFNWAWSDTCCINRGDLSVLQEALVSMFKWYERSAMTIIYLLGVDRRAPRGGLTRSVWNMRAWTLQEYHASKVVRIYTEDWTPYLDLTIYNHKDAPEIISEMEEATGISAQALRALHPGLDDIREKLRLASTRQATRVEDTAYSLLGIFSISLPITYGEGDGALGRLLARLLSDSGDTSILAWTGISGSFNSCLPTSITTFSQLPTSHIPPTLRGAETGRITTTLRSLDLALAERLYEKVNELRAPYFVGCRMKLPCLTFNLGRVPFWSQDGSESVFRAQTNTLGIVEIKTREDLSQLGSLTLIHPWIDFLLDRGKTEIIAEDKHDHTSMPSPSLPHSGPSNVTSTALTTRISRFLARLESPFGGWPVASATSDGKLLPPPSTTSAAEQQIRVLQFVARLRQPFGALLLTPNRRNVKEYKRVAAESLITVQVEKITPAILERLIADVSVLDVL